MAHLLRDLNYLIEIEKQPFALDFKTLLTDIFSLKKELIQNQKAIQQTDEQAIRLEKKLNELLMIAVDREKYPQTHKFQSSMLKYRNYILTCLYNLEVPPDNNASEKSYKECQSQTKSIWSVQNWAALLLHYSFCN